MQSLEGVLTALVTPFNAKGVDEAALRGLVRRQIDEGIHGLVACGTTGETPTLSDDEYDQVVGIVVEEAAGRVPVLAGTGSNDTGRTILTTLRAKGLGVDGALVVTPYYNKPQQAGLEAHFQAVAREGGLPVVLYNVPGRTGVNLLPSTIVALSRVPGIVGVKDASGTPVAVRDIVAGVPRGFSVLSGDDALALPSWAVGGCGVISVAGNVACRDLSKMWNSWKAGRPSEAAAIDQRLAPLYSALFLESNPAPVKAAAEMLDICAATVRPPLVDAGESTRAAVRAALSHAGLL
jgi:4-hydroxy-tetrahydrodipicolinate synthase